MPAKDIFHDAVKNALIKDGWTITDDPLYLEYGEVDLSVDLGAERLLAAEKAQEKIAVEIKSFNQPSLISAFHTALGQFLNYCLVIEEIEPERELYSVSRTYEVQSCRGGFISLIVEEAEEFDKNPPLRE